MAVDKLKELMYTEGVILIKILWIMTDYRLLFYGNYKNSFRRRSMTDKELARLKRPELLEILYYMRRELDELREENDKLKKRIDQLTNAAFSIGLKVETAESEASDE